MALSDTSKKMLEAELDQLTRKRDRVQKDINELRTRMSGAEDELSRLDKDIAAMNEDLGRTV